MGGFFVGKFLGRRKLLPIVSPNKTVEGAVGGIVFAILTSYLFSLLTSLQLTAVVAIFLGLILSVMSMIGDLSESLLKRDGKIKDSGHNIPGLGGVLDIADSLIFTAPVVYLFLRMTVGLG